MVIGDTKPYNYKKAYSEYCKNYSKEIKKVNSGNTVYDPNEARKILDGTLEERIINYAQIKYGKGKEVAAELSKGNYRENHQDAFEVLEKVCQPTAEYWGEETPESIDEVVEYKPSLAKGVWDGTKNLLKQNKIYYPFVGMLPAKSQERISGKYGDEPANYTITSGIVEGVGGIIMTFGPIIISSSPNIMLDAFAIGGALMVESALRLTVCSSSKKPMGSFLLAIPAYAALYSIAAVNAYKSACPQEQQKLLQAKPIPNAETREELLKKEAVSLQTPAIVNSVYAKEGGPEEYDAELEDFDQRLEESKRSRNI